MCYPCSDRALRLKKPSDFRDPTSDFAPPGLKTESLKTCSLPPVPKHLPTSYQRSFTFQRCIRSFTFSHCQRSFTCHGYEQDMILHSAKDIGSLVRDRRTQLGLSQSELAGRVGVSRVWIVQLEGGKPQCPARSGLANLARTQYPAASRRRTSAQAAGRERSTSRHH